MLPAPEIINVTFPSYTRRILLGLPNLLAHTYTKMPGYESDNCSIWSFLFSIIFWLIFLFVMLSMTISYTFPPTFILDSFLSSADTRLLMVNRYFTYRGIPHNFLFLFIFFIFTCLIYLSFILSIRRCYTIEFKEVRTTCFDTRKLKILIGQAMDYAEKNGQNCGVNIFWN
jgi:hypothetical protein